MGLGGRKTVNLGPLAFHLSRSGISVSVRVGWWSWNTRARRHRINLPGPLWWTSRRSRR